MTDGSRPAPRRISKIIATTVDLPLVPATARVRCDATKWASSSERWITGTPRARAAAKSGTCSSTAVETTSAAGRSGASARPEPSWGKIRIPRRSSWARDSARSPRSKARSLPLARPPFIAWNWASALMPLPPRPA